MTCINQKALSGTGEKRTVRKLIQSCVISHLNRV